MRHALLSWCVAQHQHSLWISIQFYPKFTRVCWNCGLCHVLAFKFLLNQHKLSSSILSTLGFS